MPHGAASRRVMPNSDPPQAHGAGTGLDLDASTAVADAAARRTSCGPSTAMDPSVTNTPGARHWSDLVVIVVGVSLLALAIWPGGRTASVSATQDLISPQYAWLAYIVGAVTALAAVFLSQRRGRQGLPRILLMVGAIVLLVGFFIARDTGTRAWLTLLLPGLLLFGSSFAVGPMPRGGDPVR